MVGEREIEGVPVLTLASEAAGGVKVAFAPSAGMIGCSLRHRGEELLGQRGGLRRYLEARKTMGIPLLYPWANRLGARRFEVGGREVNLELPDLPLSTDAAGLPMHGLLAAASSWEVERHEASGDGGILAARFDFAAQPLLLEAFPFPHEVGFEASLDGAELTITTSVHPRGDTAVPISFGFHPYLRLPDVARAEWSVDDAFRAPPAGQPFVLAGGGRRLELRFGENYRFAQVYAPGDDDVIAFEPMTAPANALLSSRDLPPVAPGETFTASFTLTIAP